MILHLSPIIEQYLAVINDAEFQKSQWGFEHNVESIMDTLRECHNMLDRLYSLDSPSSALESDVDYYWDVLMPHINTLASDYLDHIDHLHEKLILVAA